MIEKIHWLGHATFRIEGPGGMSIYIDPYKLKSPPKADLILITHDHFDHCSSEDIAKIASQDTVIVGPAAIVGKLTHPVRVLAPGKSINIKEVGIEAVSSYNTNKDFHPKAGGNLGYMITLEGIRIYYAGDTDVIPEMKNIKADIALLPVGGTYTMTAKEAAQAANDMNLKIAVPMHYGTIVGSEKDAEEFKKLCKVETTILKPE